MSAPAAPPKMRPAVPVSVSGAPVPVTVSSGVPMQVVSKSAAYPAGAPITYYRPPGSGVPGPGRDVPRGVCGQRPHGSATGQGDPVGDDAGGPGAGKDSSYLPSHTATIEQIAPNEPTNPPQHRGGTRILPECIWNQAREGWAAAELEAWQV